VGTVAELCNGTDARPGKTPARATQVKGFAPKRFPKNPRPILDFTLMEKQIVNGDGVANPCKGQNHMSEKSNGRGFAC